MLKNTTPTVTANELPAGPVKSEVLTLGVPDADGEVVLIGPGHEVPIGGRLF